MISNLSKHRLLVRYASSQRIEADGSPINIYFASNQAMYPLFIYSKLMPKHTHLSSIVGSPYVDEASVHFLLRVELPLGRKLLPLRCRLNPSCTSSMTCFYITRRLPLQTFQRVVLKSRPDFLLPSPVKTLEKSWKQVRSRRLPFALSTQR